MSLEKQLLTIGYSGHSINSFVSSLQEQEVTALLDIRMTPLSRKKGFSKTALSQALENAGIKYFHIRKLGSPKELRSQLYRDKDYQSFFRDYKAYLSHHENEIKEAISLVEMHQLCLMCVEPHPHECHRSVVAETIVDAASIQLRIEHIEI